MKFASFIKRLRVPLLFLISVSPWIYLTQKLFLIDPDVLQDEAVIFNVAQNINTLGKPVSTLLGGAIPGSDISHLTQGPLYYHTLALWIRIFGNSLEAGRALSVLIGFITLILFFTICRILFRSVWLAAIGTFLLGIDFFFGGATRTIRMEVLTLACILASLLCYILSFSRSIKLFRTLTGVFIGLALLTHPLGILAPVVIVAHIASEGVSWKSKFHQLIPVILIPVVMIATWLLTLGNTLPIFINQYLHLFHYDSIQIGTLTFLMQQGDFPAKLTVFVNILAIAAYMVYWIVHRTRMARFILLGLICSVAFAYIGKNEYYLLYISPWVILAVLSLFSARSPHHNLFWVIAVLLGLGLLGTSGRFYYETIANKNPAYTYHEYTSLVAQSLPTHATVMMYSQPDPYFDLQYNPGLTLIEFLPEGLGEKDVYDKLFANTDYIIINAGNPELDTLVEHNVQHTTVVEGMTFVIQLVPKTQRIIND